MAEPPLSSDDTVDRDWPAQIADTAVRIVEQIRDKTTRPAITIARALVFGLVALLVGTVAGFLFLIGSIRLINGYLPGTVWTTYLLFGAVFTLGGMFLFARRKPRPARAVPYS
jgi:vacuolar-type H+-ATPase subunit I/STV1